MAMPDLQTQLEQLRVLLERQIELVTLLLQRVELAGERERGRAK